MVIGKGGERIKDVGSKARAESRNSLGSKVFLELWVKVRPDWGRGPLPAAGAGFGPNEAAGFTLLADADRKTT